MASHRATACWKVSKPWACPISLRSHAPIRTNSPGGQRQRVMIAAALALEPAILIADEPTTALDVTTQMQILRLIKSLKQRGMGVIFITHDFGVVAEIADRVAVMQRGRIVEQGPHGPKCFRPRNMPIRVSSLRRCLMVSHPSDLYQRVSLCSNSPASTRPTAARGAGPAVDHASLEIARGETLGLVGESGSGKSTLARCAVRLVQPDSGAIRFGGTDLAPLSRAGWKPYRKRIQMVFQDPSASLNPRRRAADIVAEGPLAHGVPRAMARGPRDRTARTRPARCRRRESLSP